jgi:hypothetical protein
MASILYVLAGPIASFLLGNVSLAYAETEIVARSQASHLLVRGLLVLASLPATWALSELLSLTVPWKPRRTPPRRGLAGAVLSVSLAAYFLTLYGVGRGSYFNLSGEPQKWCAETVAGVRCFDQPGHDPVFGVELAPPTPQQVEAWKRTELDQEPRRLDIDSIEQVDFFDRLQLGKVKVWYGQDRKGEIELFDSSGYHPATGEALRPVTRELIDRFERQLLGGRHQPRLQVEVNANPPRRTQPQSRETEPASRPLVATPEARSYVHMPAVGAMPQILVVDDQGKIDFQASQHIADHLGGRTDLFSPTFIDDGLFSRAFDGDASVLTRLPLDPATGPIYLGVKTSVVEQTDYPEAGLQRAEVEIELRRYDPSNAFKASTWTGRGLGAAFSRTEAQRRAEEECLADLIRRGL